MPHDGRRTVAELLDEMNWAASPLGPRESWPASLCNALALILPAQARLALLWGPEFVALYNDACTPGVGIKHPRAFGRPLRESWGGLWDEVHPVLARVREAGETVHLKDRSFAVERQGASEQTFFDVSYSPVPGDDGGVAGVLAVFSETTGRVLADRQAREVEERYLLAARATNDAIWDWDFATNYVLWNEALETAYGYALRDVEPTGEWWIEHIHPDDRERINRSIHAAIDGGAERWSDEYRFLRADGSYAPVFDRGHVIRDADGRAMRMIGAMLDLTERRATEDKLRSSEARLRAVFDTVPVGVVIAEAPSGRINGGNEQAVRIFRHGILQSADADDYGEWKGLHADGRRVEATEYPLFRAIRGLEDRPELEVRYQRGDGTEAWVRLIASPIRDGSGAITGGVVAALDIDREKHTEARLTALNQDLESEMAQRTAERDRLWTASRELLGVADRQGRWISINPSWTRVLGWSEGEIIGRTSEWMQHPDEQEHVRKAMERLTTTGRPELGFENRFRGKDGRYRWLSWTATVDERCMYVAGRDVTADKRHEEELAHAQEQLRQSQKLEAIGQLTGGVAHDFNNLLTVIRGSVDILRREGVSEERRRRYVDAIGDTADRAAALTGQLLAFARRQALKPELFDAGESLGEVAAMLRTMAGSRIRLDISIPDERCFILADRSQFDTALVNLGINARDAMNGEGVLRMTTGPVSGIPAIRSHPPIAGDYVAVTISDEGEGINADDLPKIFEPFFTTKEVGKGTGLGLSQVIGFAKQSGGDIRVESEPGAGTTFTLYLPRAFPEAAGEAIAEAIDDAVGGEGVCVLLVEDNEQVGRFATEALKELGYDSVHAMDAEQALRALEDDSGRFQVVFSDVVMPGRSGLELGEEIRRRFPHVPVVLTSGYSHVLAQNGKHGFELLHKPYSVEQLSRVLRKAIAWRPARV